MPTFPGRVAAIRRVPASGGCAITSLYDLAAFAPPGSNKHAVIGGLRTGPDQLPINTHHNRLRGQSEPAASWPPAVGDWDTNHGRSHRHGVITSSFGESRELV